MSHVAWHLAEYVSLMSVFVLTCFCGMQTSMAIPRIHLYIAYRWSIGRDTCNAPSLAVPVASLGNMCPFRGRIKRVTFNMGKHEVSICIYMFTLTVTTQGHSSHTLLHCPLLKYWQRQSCTIAACPSGCYQKHLALPQPITPIISSCFIISSVSGNLPII
jgi:hypothetical protein